MRRILLVLSLGAACASMTACADTYYATDGGHHRLHAYEHTAIGYDGFYDGHYGPVYDGYWSSEGFYYSPAEGRPYVLDRENHFRHDAYNGYTEFHGGHYRDPH